METSLVSLLIDPDIKKTRLNPKKDEVWEGNRGNSQGRLSIVGTGPGAISHLTEKAVSTIAKSQVIVGYKTYIRLLGSLADNKEVVSTGMAEEIERARYAIKKAQEGKNVCIISSGDPGVCGMVGLVLELLNERDSDIKIEVIPGIPASSSCASLLGVPLMHDFVSISLSDLLTDKGLIKKRVELAAKGDFVIVFYNPKSKKRVQPLKDVWNILMRYRSPETPVGIVRNAYRDSQEIQITDLSNMLNSRKIDMFTTIIVGNTKTYVKNRFMITPRGYDLNISHDPCFGTGTPSLTLQLPPD